MRRLAALTLILAAGCAGPESRPRPAGFESVERRYSCPDPPKKGLTIYRADGSAQLVIWDGPYGDRGPAREMRHRKTLSASQVRELSRFLSRSGYEKLPEKGPEQPMGQALCYDCCDGSLSIRTAAGERTFSWRGEDGRRKDLEALLSGLEAVAEKTPWLPDTDWVRPEN